MISEIKVIQSVKHTAVTRTVTARTTSHLTLQSKARGVRETSPFCEQESELGKAPKTLIFSDRV